MSHIGSHADFTYQCHTLAILYLGDVVLRGTTTYFKSLTEHGKWKQQLQQQLYYKSRFLVSWRD